MASFLIFDFKQSLVAVFLYRLINFSTGSVYCQIVYFKSIIYESGLIQNKGETKLFHPFLSLQTLAEMVKSCGIMARTARGNAGGVNINTTKPVAF